MSKFFFLFTNLFTSFETPPCRHMWGGGREKQLGIDSPVAEVREGSKVEVSAGQTYNIRGNIMQYIYIYIYTVQYSIQHLPHLSRNIWAFVLSEKSFGVWWWKYICLICSETMLTMYTFTEWAAVKYNIETLCENQANFRIFSLIMCTVLLYV